MSFLHQPFNLALKSSNIAIKNRLWLIMFYKLISIQGLQKTFQIHLIYESQILWASEVTDFVANHNLKVSAFQKTLYVKNFQRQQIIIVQAHTPAFRIEGMGISEKIVTSCF